MPEETTILTPPVEGTPLIEGTAPLIDQKKGDEGTGTILTDDSTSKTSWRDEIPDTLRENEKLVGFKSVAELAEAYASAQLAPTIPDEDAYVIPEDVKQDMPTLGKWAKEAGLTQAQVDKVLSLNKETMSTAIARLEEQNKQGLEELYNDWGPNKDGNISLAKQFIGHFDTTGSLRRLLNDTRAGNNPAVVAFFANVGRAVMGEDGFIKPAGAPEPTPRSAADVIFDGN